MKCILKDSFVDKIRQSMIKHHRALNAIKNCSIIIIVCITMSLVALSVGAYLSSYQPSDKTTPAMLMLGAKFIGEFLLFCLFWTCLPILPMKLLDYISKKIYESKLRKIMALKMKSFAKKHRTKLIFIFKIAVAVIVGFLIDVIMLEFFGWFLATN